MTVRTKTALLICVLGASWLAPRALPAQALSAPDNWVTIAERFVAMPPGWHITTSGSVLLHNIKATAERQFGVRSEGFLFSGESDGTYGLFIGGRDLASDAAAWTSFEIGRDGTWVIRQRNANTVEDLVGPQAGPVALPEDGPAKNVLQIEAGESSVAFILNDSTVAELPREGMAVEGIFGFRVGANLNLHLTTLSTSEGDKVRSFAPQPADEEAGS